MSFVRWIIGPLLGIMTKIIAGSSSDPRPKVGVENARSKRSEDRHNGMGYTYVLRCIDSSYYVGSTRVIEDRLKAHSGGFVKYTKSRLPIKLVFLKKFESYYEARDFERKVKSWKKRKSIERMLNKPDNIVSEYCGIV